MADRFGFGKTSKFVQSMDESTSATGAGAAAAARRHSDRIGGVDEAAAAAAAAAAVVATNAAVQQTQIGGGFYSAENLKQTPRILNDFIVNPQFQIAFGPTDQTADDAITRFRRVDGGFRWRSRGS